MPVWAHKSDMGSYKSYDAEPIWSHMRGANNHGSELMNNGFDEFVHVCFTIVNTFGDIEAGQKTPMHPRK